MLHASSAGGDASSAGDAVRGRLRALFPRFFADGAIGVAAERAFMHQGGEVDEAAVQEAHRALMAMNHLGVVLAKVKHRDMPTARLVVVAIAVHRGLFRRDDGTLDLKKAFTTIYGRDYKNKLRVHLWASRLAVLESQLLILSEQRLSNFESVCREEEQQVAIARQRYRRQAVEVCFPSLLTPRVWAQTRAEHFSIAAC